MEKVDTVLTIVTYVYAKDFYTLVAKEHIQVFNFPEDTYILNAADGYIVTYTKDINEILEHITDEINLVLEDSIGTSIIYTNSLVTTFKIVFETAYVVLEVLHYKEIPEVAEWFNNLKTKLSGGN